MLLHSLTDTMLAAHSASAPDVLAQVGPSGVEAPPGAPKYQTLMNIGMWVGVAVLACVGVWAGVKFAVAHQEGTNTRGQQFGLASVAIGAVFAGTATPFVNYFFF